MKQVIVTLMAVGLLNNRYHIEEPLGRGSDGSVYRVVDTVSGAVLALKLVDQNATGARGRAAAEFAALAQLNHPNLVKAVDLSTVTAPIPGFAAGNLFLTRHHWPCPTHEAKQYYRDHSRFTHAQHSDSKVAESHGYP